MYNGIQKAYNNILFYSNPSNYFTTTPSLSNGESASETYTPLKVNCAVMQVFPGMHVPKNVVLQIFSHMSLKELGRCSRVDKVWNGILADSCAQHLWLDKLAVGKKKWATYFGDIGEEPPLPEDMVQILKSPCPFWKNKRVAETHVLVLIPATVDGKKLTLDTLEELIKNPKEGNTARYHRYCDHVKTEHGDKSIEHSYWVLMTRHTIPSCRGKIYSELQKLISTYKAYHIPQAREAAICILMEYITSGKKLYLGETFWDRGEPKYTRCEEKVQGQLPVYIGNMHGNSLYIESDFFDFGIVNIGAVRKL